MIWNVTMSKSLCLPGQRSLNGNPPGLRHLFERERCGSCSIFVFLVVFEIGEPPKDLDKAKRLPVWAWTARVPLCRLLQKNRIYWSTDTPTVSRSIGYYRQGRRGPNRDQELGARSWRSNSSCNNCSSSCTVSVSAAEKRLRVCV